MPIYEEKLISPLALRFTQEHIKTVFRDGHVVEDTVDEIEVRPSANTDYDLILQAPFPQIEIIRWGRDSDGTGEGLHWFTLDNRRLYCLQRAAMKHWPQRVAAKVEILYADPGMVKKKYDSTTMGASVTLANSCKDTPLFRWDWQVEVEKLGDDVAGQEVPTRDDARREVADLPDAAEAEGSTLDRMLAIEEAHQDGEDGAECGEYRWSAAARCPTPSTAANSEDSDGSPSSCVQRLYEKKRNREPLYPRDDDEEYASWALHEINRQLWSHNSDGRLRIHNWAERYGAQLGSLRKFVEARPDMYTVIAEKEGKFRVQLVNNSWEAEDGSNADSAALAKQAIAEMKEQLTAQGGEGSVQIHDWNGRYAWSLGPFKTFVRSRPGEFSVLPSTGKFFKVALAA